MVDWDSPDWGKAGRVHVCSRGSFLGEHQDEREDSLDKPEFIDS